MIPLMISARSFALTPELVIAIATAALAIATFALAGVTVWVALETRKTAKTAAPAKTAAQALELEQIPILGVRDLRVEITSHPRTTAFIASIQVGIELSNAGRFPVKYHVKSFAISLGQQYIQTGDFSGGRVLPAASAMLWHPVWDFNTPISTFPAKGIVDFEYEYSGELDGQPHTTSEKLQYTISIPPTGGVFPEDFRVRWLNASI